MAKDDINIESAFHMEPKEIVKYFESKGCKISFDWHEVYEDAHAKAFTVAKMTQADLLKDTQDMLTQAIKEGWTEKKFEKNAAELFTKKGWVGHKEMTNPKTGETKTVELGTPRRIKTIFQSNMHSAYSVGRYKQQLEDADIAPYWMYQCIMDGKTRPEHKAMHGKVFRYDDEFWQNFYPPNGWGCRCFVKSLTENQLNKRGLKCEKSEGKIRDVIDVVGGVERGNKAYDFNIGGKNFTLKPDAGWGTNLAIFDYIPNLEKYNYKTASNTAKIFVNSKVFDRYYNKCSELAKKIETKAISDLAKRNITQTGEIQSYAIKELLNKKYSNLIKNTAFDIAILNEQQKRLLKTKTQTLKLSAETLIKELIKHKDLSIDDFRNIQTHLGNLDVLIYKNDLENLLCFKLANDKFIVLALKTTKDKTLNFIKTLHLTHLSELKKELKKANNTIIFNKLDIKKE